MQKQPNDPTSPPKKKRRILRWIAGIFTCLFLLVVLQRFLPSPPIAFSPQTTVISSPLRPDGFPDYRAYVLELSRKGVTPENNAAVLIWKALGACGLNPKQYRAVAAELDLPDTPSDAALKGRSDPDLQKQIGELLQSLKPSADEPDVDALLRGAEAKPWTRAQIRPLADWVDNNQSQIDMIVEAAKRPRFYSPSPSFFDDNDTPLIETLMPGVQGARDAANALATRSMLLVGENRLDDAWRDIFAIHRLAVLISQGPGIIDQLVAIAARTIACQATVALLSSDRLTKDLAHKIQNDLAGLQPFSRMADCVDQHERLCTLDSVIHARIYGFQSLGGSDKLTDRQSSPAPAAVDWNVILRKINRAYDAAVGALRTQDHDARKTSFARFEKNIESESNDIHNPISIAAAYLSRTKRSEMIASILNALMLPSIEATISAEDRINSQLALTQLGAALAVFRTEHGTYPENLDDCVPGIVEKRPTDLFHGSKFIFKRTDDGYLLYSAGENGQDDGGSNSMMHIDEGQSSDDFDASRVDDLLDKIPANADDFAVRVPVPPIGLPAAP